jgi:phage protein U
MLLSVGPVAFDLVVNVHEFSRDDVEDFARKDVIGARKPYEHVGPGDDVLTYRGRLLPEKLGGAGAIEALRAIKAAGAPQMVVRGDGMALGWRVITSLSEQGSYLAQAGNPRLLEFDIKLEACGAPTAAGAFGAMMNILG